MEMTREAYMKIIDTIPIDTGGLIRVGMLDLINGYGSKDITGVIDSLSTIATDTQDLRNVAVNWNEKNPLAMESGTLFRQVWFYYTKKGISRQIIPMRTLIERVKKMPLNPEIVNWSLYQLGKLEGGTSQWQTAAILNGNTEVLLEVPFYLRKTYDIKTKWKSKRDAGEIWEVPRDPTLITQSEDYLIFLETGQIRTKPEKLGDCDLYCFLRTFGVVEREWGEKNWPQLAEHESNRLETTDIMISQKENGETIVSDDHRIVQAAAMKIQAEAFRKGTYLPVEEIKQRFSNPNCVAKKWPEFWKAMDYFPKAALEGY